MVPVLGPVFCRLWEAGSPGFSPSARPSISARQGLVDVRPVGCSRRCFCAVSKGLALSLRQSTSRII